jgi:hypothetical protein
MESMEGNRPDYMSCVIQHIHINIKFFIIHFIVLSYFNVKELKVEIINMTVVLTKSIS